MAGRSRVILLATTLDWLLGEPPNALHPVAWFGRFVQARVMEAVQEMVARHLGVDESVLLVAHGACLRTLTCGWLGIELSAYWKIAFDSGSVSEVSLSPAGAVLSV